MFFCLVVRGVYPPYTLSVPTTKKTTFFYVCLPLCMFQKNFLSIIKQWILLKSAGCPLPTCYGSFWFELRMLFKRNAVFCLHNIAGINGPKVSFTEALRCLVAFTNLRIKITDLRWRLPVRSWRQFLFRYVVYQSAVSLPICRC